MSDHLLYSLNYCTSLTRATVSIIGTDHRAKEEWYRANSVDMFESLDHHNNTTCNVYNEYLYHNSNFTIQPY